MVKKMFMLLVLILILLLPVTLAENYVTLNYDAQAIPTSEAIILNTGTYKVSVEVGESTTFENQNAIFLGVGTYYLLGLGGVTEGIIPLIDLIILLEDAGLEWALFNWS